jgi:hypothetical protein
MYYYQVLGYTFSTNQLLQVKMVFDGIVLVWLCD